MREAVARLDEWGTGAWVAAMIAGFVLFWPAGLAILAYMVWSGRMGWMHQRLPKELREEWQARHQAMHEEIRARREEWRARKRAWREAMHEAWRRERGSFRSSGNAAFDEYRAATLQRLEEEQAEFAAFLDGLRKARDRAEFDQFMQSRRSAAERSRPDEPPAEGPQANP